MGIGTGRRAGVQRRAHDLHRRTELAPLHPTDRGLLAPASASTPADWRSTSHRAPSTLWQELTRSSSPARCAWSGRVRLRRRDPTRPQGRAQRVADPGHGAGPGPGIYEQAHTAHRAHRRSAPPASPDTQTEGGRPTGTASRRRRSRGDLLLGELAADRAARHRPPRPRPPARSGATRPRRGLRPSRQASSPGQLATPLSREALVAVGNRLRILGGLSPSGSSLNEAFWVDPASGTVAAAGSLADIVHDGAGAQIGATSFVFGGGSPDTFATVQSLGAAAGTGAVAGQLPQPRSDLATATIGHTAYIVGGYDGTTYEPSVLATTDGTRFTSVATLPVPVRYPAVVALGGDVFSVRRADRQRSRQHGDHHGSDPGDRPRDTHRPRRRHPAPARFGAAAFVIDDHIYLAGGQTGGGQTLTQLYEYDQRTHRVADAGLLPQAVAFGGYATVGTGKLRSGTSWAGRSPSSRATTRRASQRGRWRASSRCGPARTAARSAGPPPARPTRATC